MWIKYVGPDESFNLRGVVCVRGVPVETYDGGLYAKAMAMNGWFETEAEKQQIQEPQAKPTKTEQAKEAAPSKQDQPAAPSIASAIGAAVVSSVPEAGPVGVSSPPSLQGQPKATKAKVNRRKAKA